MQRKEQPRVVLEEHFSDLYLCRGNPEIERASRRTIMNFQNVQKGFIMKKQFLVGDFLLTSFRSSR